MTITIINYSERAIALIGDTKDNRSLLKALGGKYNPRLTCGAGWVFSVRKRDQICGALAAAGVSLKQ